MVCQGTDRVSAKAKPRSSGVCRPYRLPEFSNGALGSLLWLSDTQRMGCYGRAGCPLKPQAGEPGAAGCPWGSTEMEVLTITLRGDPPMQLDSCNSSRASWTLQLHLQARSLWTEVLGPRGTGRLGGHSPLPCSLTPPSTEMLTGPPGLMSCTVTSMTLGCLV